MQIARIPAGGRFLRAVPYSSPISKLLCSFGRIRLRFSLLSLALLLGFGLLIRVKTFLGPMEA